MSATKNMVRGTIFASIYVITTIGIPLLLFNWMKNLQIPYVGEIILTQESYSRIIFWIVALGMVVCGCAFFSYSSPKQSIRKAIFAFVQVTVNCLYIWSYKFSGASDILLDFEITGYSGFLYINLQTMILVYMGVYFLSIILKVYDIIDFAVNRKLIRENRMKA
ncbi:MAG: hypothetical protein ACFE9Q_06555 [Candidatus Hodarchaeota archaeon]